MTKLTKFYKQRAKRHWVRKGVVLGILLLGVNRPIWAGLTSSIVKHVKAHEDRWGLKTHNRLRACGRKPASICNLYCKLGISRDQTGHIYEPVLGLCEPMGVTRVYKGTTRRRFRQHTTTWDLGEACLLPSHRNPINSITTRRRLLPSSKGLN